MFKKIVLVIFLVLALIISLRNFIASSLVSFVLSRKIQAECSIDRANINFSGLYLQGVSLKKTGLDLFLQEAGLKFSYNGFSSGPAFFFCREGKVEIDDKSLFLTGPGLPGKAKIKGRAEPLDIDLSEINFVFRDNDLGFFSGSVSFSGKVKAGIPVLIKDIRLEKGAWSKQDTALTGVRVCALPDNGYILNVGELKFKKEKVRDIALPFKLGLDRIEVLPSIQPFFGPSGSIRALIQKKNKNLLCFHLRGENISFGPLLSFAREKEDISLEGFFSGDLTVCLKKMRPLLVQGSMSNRSGGRINIRNEASLDFLRQYLDRASYRRIIDNLKNYSYNESIISFSSEGPDIRAALRFESKEMGKRDFVVTFHDLLGGEQ